MDHQFTYNYFKKLTEHDVIFSFSGMISQDILVDLGSALTNSLSLFKVSEKTSKKIFAVYIELAQNIVKYSALRKNTAVSGNRHGYGSVLIGRNEKAYTLQSGNLVENGKVAVITEKCNYIRSLSRTELHNYYKNQRRLPREKFKKSAGLGFIDIALNTTGGLNIRFIPVDSNHSFFIFTVTILKD
ncbi:MAG: SiaB family protein kinase [Bacteroidetes bacterium]|nr:SiaB family protein kinase [Bacteroidota bacterium]